MKSLIKQQGSALHMGIIIVLVVAVIGLLGFTFWQNFMARTTGEAANEQQAVEQENTNKVSEPAKESVGTNLVSKDFRTNDNFGITYQMPSTWTGGSYGGGDTLSDSETTSLRSPDGFVITMTMSRLLRGWTHEDPTSSVLEVQQKSNTDISWLVVDSNPISLQINNAQSLPSIGSQKVTGSSIYRLGEVDGAGVYLEIYGSYTQDMSFDDFIAKESVQQAKAIFESIKLDKS